jgi:acetolactate synthase-1/2/3 large subunit
VYKRQEALDMNKPVLIECMVHPNDLVLPMVPAGEPINECIDDF